MPELKTEAEHREYLEQMAALSFFFAKKWLAAEFPAERISTLLLQHTPLLHYLNFTEKEWTSHPDCCGFCRNLMNCNLFLLKILNISWADPFPLLQPRKPIWII